MGPTILLDKSTIQGLNHKEVEFLHRYYNPLITPILMRELISTLAKDEDQTELQKKLSGIAKKLDGIQSFYCADASMLAISSLVYNDIPLTGQVPMAGGKRVRAMDGTIAHMFDEAPERKILRNWERNIFTVEDKTNAEIIRKGDHAINLVTVKKEYQDKIYTYPRFKNQAQIVKWLNDVLYKSASQEMLLNIAMDIIDVPDNARALILERWNKDKVKNFIEFTSYGSYYLKVILFFQIGIGQELIPTSKKDKSHLDTQYLLYLPFSHCFSSGDKYLNSATPNFLRKDQFMITREQIKKDLNVYIRYWSSITDESERALRIKEFGDYPPTATEETFTQSIHNKIIGPKPVRSEEEKPRPKEETKKILNRLKMITEMSVDHITNKSINQKAASQYSDCNLEDRTNLAIEKMLEVFKIENEDSLRDLKKTMTPEQVSEFYEFYGNIWRPDLDYHKFLPKPKACARALYLGDILPEMFLSFIISNIFLFDEILIVDPILNPWAMKHEFNPIGNPSAYMEDTLKIVIFYVTALPFIDAGIIKIIHDPFDLNLETKKELINYLEKTRKPMGFSKRGEEEIEVLRRKQFTRIAQRVSQYQDPTKLKKFLNLNDNELEAIHRHLKQQSEKDLISLEQPLPPQGGTMNLLRNGLDIESSIYISRLTQALPATNFWENRRMLNINLKGSKNPSGGISKMLKELQIPVFHGADPYTLCALHKDGFLKNLRKLIYFSMLSLQQKNQKIQNVLGNQHQAILGTIKEEVEYIVEANRKDGHEDKIELINFEILSSTLGLDSKFANSLLLKNHKVKSLPPPVPIAIYTPVNFDAVISQL